MTKRFRRPDDRTEPGCRKVALVAAAIVVALFLGACSGDSPVATDADDTDANGTDSTDENAGQGSAAQATTAPLDQPSDGDSPSTLPTALAVPTTSPLASGQGCPIGQETVTATVTGVEEWVRMRAAPSVDSAELGKLDAGAIVTAFPKSLTYDGTSFYWVTIVQPASGDCANVAANFLTGPLDRLDRPVPGVSFRPPSTGAWTYEAPTSADGQFEWSFDDAGLLVNATLQVVTGAVIDSELAAQLATFEAEDYDYPSDWFDDVVVPGADRAVALNPIISSSGDVTSERVLIEVGGFTIDAQYGVYIEDVGIAPFDDLQQYLTSFEIDRAIFLAAMAG